MGDRLRPLWAFDDLDASEAGFRARLEQEESDAGRAEVLTQLARVEGLRGDFDRGELLLLEAESLAGSSTLARVRIQLERGRLRRSSEDVEAALPLFESSFATALESGEHFIAADAAHMAALAAPGRDGFVAWTQRGIDVAESEPGAAYWLGPLLHNLGWEYYDAGDYEDALEAFRRALDAREREPEKPLEIEIGRCAVAKALRGLGRTAEAAALVEECVAWTEREGRPDSWFREELAEDYAALGRDAEAREQAKRALALLETDGVPDPNGERAARLRELAA